MPQFGPFPRIGGLTPLGFSGGQNPVLIPQFSANVGEPGPAFGIAKQSPYDFLAANPRTNSTITATIGGTATSSTTVSLTLTSPLFANPYLGITSNAVTVTYAVAVGDTLATIAEGLASLINSNPLLQPFVFASTAEAVLTLNWPGPVGNFATLTGSASADETVTIPNSGVLSGGAGPVWVWMSFNWGAGNMISEFIANRFYNMSGVLAAMVAQGMPIS